MRWLCRALIDLAAAIVPVAFRDDWTREWRAELWHAADRRPASLSADIDLVVRCAGAVMHAAWLRKEEWSLAVILQDVRYALRGLRSRPGFTAVAVATLALGIGANAAVFSVVHGVLLAPLPFREPDRLVQIWETNPRMNWTAATVAPANLLDWKARQRSFEDIGHYMGSDTRAPGTTSLTLTGSGEPERVRGTLVSANLFSVLGVTPALGRAFRPEEEMPGRTRVVVLSDAFWRRRFASDPSIVGRSVELNGAAYEVAGVMPRAFQIPGATADFWMPRTFSEEQARQQRRPHFFRVVARLRPGVTLEQARGDMTGIAAQLEREYPDTNTQMGVGLGPLHEWIVGDVRGVLFALMGTVALVLLVACTNVASLLLARATARRREMAIRVALGAGRVRLIRQLLAESALLAVAGAACGLLVARVGLEVLRRLGPALPRVEHVSIDGAVLAFVAAIACATSLVFGMAPAWRQSSATADRLKEGARGTTGGALGVRRALVVIQVAMAVMLLVGAGLLLRSFNRLRGVDPGVNTSHAISFRLSLPGLRYDSPEKVTAFFGDAVERLRAVPGVTEAGATSRMALEGYAWTGDLFIESRPDVWGRDLRHKTVTAGYFAAAGLRLVRGRDFDATDTATAPPAIVINQSLARQYFGDGDPLGQRVAFARPSPATRWRTIVGVVADEKQDGLGIEVKPEMYDALAQNPTGTMAFVVRTAGEPAAMLPALKHAVGSMDPSLAVYDVRTLDQVLAESLAGERFTAVLLVLFAGVGLTLAAVGLYGIIAFTVTERTREIGVRLALGATRAGVLRMVVWDGVRLVIAGLIIGIAAAVAATRAAQSFLFETAPTDPLVLVTVAAMLGAVGALASYAPAFRASRVDPAVSLRAD